MRRLADAPVIVGTQATAWTNPCHSSVEVVEVVEVIDVVATRERGSVCLPHRIAPVSPLTCRS
jgi:hypothetical protein